MPMVGPSTEENTCVGVTVRVDDGSDGLTAK